MPRIWCALSARSSVVLPVPFLPTSPYLPQEPESVCTGGLRHSMTKIDLQSASAYPGVELQCSPRSMTAAMEA